MDKRTDGNRQPRHGEVEASLIMTEIYDERMRQRTAEGYTDAHDNRHTNGELAVAGACYAAQAASNCRRGAVVVVDEDPGTEDSWPWADHDGRNDHPTRRCLVIAAALLVAEIERLDRDAAFKGLDPKTLEPKA